MTQEEARAELARLQEEAKKTQLEDIRVGMTDAQYTRACADILAALNEGK